VRPCSLSQNWREGDFLESAEGMIFDVKGLVHPPGRVVAFVRYMPDVDGTRVREGRRYRKVYELDDRYKFLETNYPEYIVHDGVFDEDIIEVPIDRISRVYRPLEKTEALIHSQTRTRLEQKAVEMMATLSEVSGVSLGDFGLTGSILVGLAESASDIDLVIYGSEKSCRVRESLRKLLEEEEAFCPYSDSILLNLYKTRHRETGVSFEDYVLSEARKSFQGLFRGTDFFVRYVKDWFEVEEIYGSTMYRKIGSGSIEGIVSDDQEAFFTPCTYSLRDVSIVDGPEVGPLTEIVSFRGRFCEQAMKGDRIRAQGKIESKRVNQVTSYRLVLGNSGRDYMIVLDH